MIPFSSKYQTFIAKSCNFKKGYIHFWNKIVIVLLKICIGYSRILEQSRHNHYVDSKKIDVIQELELEILYCVRFACKTLDHKG